MRTPLCDLLGIDVPVRMVFEAPTLGAFVAAIDARLGAVGAPGARPALVRAPRGEPPEVRGGV